MPWIDEDGERFYVTGFERDVLVKRGLVYECSECGTLHHDEYERWDEIRAMLKTATEFFSLTSPSSSI